MSAHECVTEAGCVGDYRTPGARAPAHSAVDHDLRKPGIAKREAQSPVSDESLAMLGHELRNSLSAIRNAVACARLLDCSASQQALNIAWRQTEHLARLIDDLFDVAHVHDRVRLNRQRVALMDVVEHAVEAMRFLVEDRGHTLIVSPPVDSVLVDGDPSRLEQIVVNLLSNAAKYMERGGRIELVVARQGHEAVLRVRDSGIGIPPDMLARIFELFVQGDCTLEHAHGGLGIGLAVVRSLVALHDGRVEARSEGSGKGAEFAVYLPSFGREISRSG
jgi:signal transduction histidine kinase